MGEQAGQAAIGAEPRGPRVRGARPPLVPVGRRENARAITHFEGVLDQPFEGAPGGMDLDRAFQLTVVTAPDVGVTAADMGEHHDVLARQLFEQVFDAVGVLVQIGPVLDQGMGRAEDGPAFLGVEDVAVAAEAGIGRPFIAGNDDESGILREFARQHVQFGPELRRDLEIVALVHRSVEERLVAGEGEIGARVVGADGLL